MKDNTFHLQCISEEVVVCVSKAMIGGSNDDKIDKQ